MKVEKKTTLSEHNNFHPQDRSITFISTSYKSDLQLKKSISNSYPERSCIINVAVKFIKGGEFIVENLIIPHDDNYAYEIRLKLDSIAIHYSPINVYECVYKRVTMCNQSMRPTRIFKRKYKSRGMHISYMQATLHQ